MIPKYSVGNIAYFVIFSNCSVHSVNIINVYFTTMNSQQYITYDIKRTDTGDIIKGVLESDLTDFPTAKQSLITYLTQQLAIANALQVV